MAYISIARSLSRVNSNDAILSRHMIPIHYGQFIIYLQELSPQRKNGQLFRSLAELNDWSCALLSHLTHGYVTQITSNMVNHLMGYHYHVSRSPCPLSSSVDSWGPCTVMDQARWPCHVAGRQLIPPNSWGIGFMIVPEKHQAWLQNFNYENQTNVIMILNISQQGYYRLVLSQWEMSL